MDTETKVQRDTGVATSHCQAGGEQALPQEGEAENPGLKLTDVFHTLTAELPAEVRCGRSADCHSETRNHLGRDRLSTGASLAQPHLRLCQTTEQPPPSGLTNQETQNTAAEHEFRCRPALNL